MVVDSSSGVVGTIGGGCVEADIRKKAFYLIQQKDSALISIDLNNESAAENGLICGGSMSVAVMTMHDSSGLPLIQAAINNLISGVSATIPVRVKKGDLLVEYRWLIEPEPVLLIAGAGHIGQELAHLALKLDFRIVVVDNRADFASVSRFPHPIDIKVGDIIEELKKQRIDFSTYVVIVTRGHRYDQEALQVAIGSNAKYIGMIGSRRKIHLIFKELESSGVSPELLKKVFAPIGLPLNAVTPGEIALSIAAQLVQIRRERKTEAIQGPFEVSSHTG